MADPIPGIIENGPVIYPRRMPDLYQPGALDQISAGFQLENTIVHGLSQRVLPPPEQAPFRDEWDVRDVVTRDEFMSGRFDTARDDRQVEAIRQNLHREKRLREDMQAGPLSSALVGLFAAGVDPFTYIGPAATPFRLAGAGGRALAYGADAALGIAASEIVLSSQDMRHGSEALASMLMGTLFGAGVGAALRPGAREFGDALAPTPKYTSVRDELATYMASVSSDAGSLARLSDSTAVGRFLDSPSLKWTFNKAAPPPGVLDDGDLLRFAMGRSTRLFDAVETAARRLEELDNPLALAIARTDPDLTASRLERQSIMARIVELEGKDNPAAQKILSDNGDLPSLLKAIDDAPSARKDPVAATQAAALRQRVRELDEMLPLRVRDDADALTWQVNKARDAAAKEYEDALGKLRAQLERERAKMAKLTASLGHNGVLEAHAKIMELKDALARGIAVDEPKANWMDEIAAFNAAKEKPKPATFDEKAAKAAQPKGDAIDKAPTTAVSKGESIDVFGLCGGL